MGVAILSLGVIVLSLPASFSLESLLLLFLGWEYWLGDKAMLPFSILERRTVVGAAFESVSLGG